MARKWKFVAGDLGPPRSLSRKGGTAGRVAKRPALVPVSAESLLDAALLAIDAAKQTLPSSFVALDGFGRILGLSPNIAGLLGVNSPIGRRFAHRLKGGDRARFQIAMVHLRATRKRFALEVLLRSTSGDAHPVSLTVALLPQTDRGTVVVLEVALKG